VYRAKELEKSKHLHNLLQKISEGAIVVEGKHDKAALQKLGLASYTFYDLIGNPGVISTFSSKKVYLLFDNDKGGEDKKQKMLGFLSSCNPAMKVDDSTGRRLLSLLNCTSVEQVYGPLAKFMDFERGDFDGENILRHSKVHGSSELQH